MGVLGLWQILESVGHPIKIEGLEGKRLGVDANVWLYKFIRGFREKDQATSIESHKLGLFNRISKLLFYKIKPVFVFDGPAPVLKRRTLEKRQNVRNKQLAKVQETAMRLVAEELKKQYPNADIDDLKIKLPELRSHHLVAAEKLTDEDMELFKLPTITETIDDQSDEEWDSFTPSQPINLPHIKKEEATVYHIDSDEEVSIPDVKLDLQQDVDIFSDDFAKLPAEVRYEILVDIRESRRKLRRAHTLPEDADSFSNLQFERLKQRRTIQEKIEQCEKEICSMYTGEMNGQTVRSYRIQSDANSTMLYMQNASDPMPKSQGPVIYNTPKEESKIERPGPLNLKPSIFSSQEKKNPALRPLMDFSPKKGSSIGFRLINHERYANESSSNPGESFTSSKSPSFSESSSSDTETEVDSTQPSQETTICDAVEETNNSVQAISPSRSKLHDTILIESDISSSSSSSPEPTILIDTTSEKLSISPGQRSPQTSLIEESGQRSRSPSLSTTPQSLQPPSAEKPQSPSPPLTPIPLSPQPSSSTKKPLSPSPLPSPIPLSPQPSSSTEKLQPSVQENKQPPIISIEHEEAPVKSATQMDSTVIQTEQQIPFILSKEGSAELRAQKSTSTRVTNRVTTKIVDEAKELLRLFGIPYIDATGEAEAQCALLEKLKLTEGTITDDSDVWLFGAQNVYRYFFSNDKYVMQYKMRDIEFHIRMNRENLVCFAMLVGSDYTDGLRNVGPVTAVEILSEFPGEGLEPLIKFRNWKDKYLKSKDRIPGSKTREKLLKFKLPEDFPSRTVFEGYMRPEADTSTEKFTWGVPELDELREYARRNFAWDMKKIDEQLLPIMKKLSEKKNQTTIDSFFFKTAANQNPELFRSKRVNKALNKIAKTSSQDDDICLSEVELSDDDNLEAETQRSSTVKKKSKNEKRSVSRAKKKSSPKARTHKVKRRKVNED